MIDPVKLLSDDMRTRSVLQVVAGAVALLILALIVYTVVSAWLDFMVGALDPGLVLFTSATETASIGGLGK